MSSVTNRFTCYSPQDSHRHVNVAWTAYSLTSVVFSTFGGMSHECHRAFKRAAGKSASKGKENCANVMGHISTQMSQEILQTCNCNIDGAWPVSFHNVLH